MKNVILICFAFSVFVMNAQEHKHEMNHHRKEQMKKMDFSPKQMADLSTKKMVLELDLNEKQQKEINTIFLEEATLRKQMMEKRKEKKELSSDDRYKMKSDQLDRQIAMKKSMKAVLSPEQYNKWENTIRSKKKHKKSEIQRKNG